MTTAPPGSISVQGHGGLRRSLESFEMNDKLALSLGQEPWSCGYGRRLMV